MEISKQYKKIIDEMGFVWDKESNSYVLVIKAKISKTLLLCLPDKKILIENIKLNIGKELSKIKYLK